MYPRLGITGANEGLEKVGTDLYVLFLTSTEKKGNNTERISTAYIRNKYVLNISSDSYPRENVLL